MTPEERQNIVQYRLQKAEKTIGEEVPLNVVNQCWNFCANRLYYAAFYAVRALLFKKGLNPQTHHGVRTLFIKNFVQTNVLGIETASFYAELFDKQQAADYTDLLDWTEEDILPLIEPTKELIETIKKLIQTEN